MAHFVVRVTTPEEAGGDVISLVGPFVDNDAARDWGATFCSPGGPDDPRWGVIDLPLPDGIDRYLVHIEAPTGTVETGAYARLPKDG